MPPSSGYPAFYSCYLLKSLQSPSSTATYIGSTPNPPKRIRQHNGELAQGAWKTKSRRPWAMQMIVYGFPSKLSALQFEWAWQHSHKTRHLRDANGKALLSRASGLNSNIRAVRLMIATHPWSTWPLHVKLFTPAAVKGWTAAQKTTPPLPQGFTYTVELEGVDGKSGVVGSGRDGPIIVDDAEFTSALLAKSTVLLASGTRISCVVCNELISNYSTDPLATVLCPAAACSAVAHITCLSHKFLAAQAHASTSSNVLPRGGNCSACGTYVLWGDIVRGSFRRAAGGVPPELEGDDDALFMPDTDVDEALTHGKSKKTAGKRPVDASSGGEEFDFAAVETTSDREEPRKRGRPRKVTVASDKPASPRKKATSAPAPKKRGRPPASATFKNRGESSSGESFDFENLSGSSDDEGLPSRRPKTTAAKKSNVTSSGESFDLNVSGSSEGNLKSPRKKAGRPRKDKVASDVDSSDLFQSDSADEQDALSQKMKTLSVDVNTVIIVSD
ncbi:hypothetical protein C8F01DRAFT_250575 [Mycena amicta]|nr:hypothetical protein C8F01DRAFT_250575 [Mycena amicta]